MQEPAPEKRDGYFWHSLRARDRRIYLAAVSDGTTLALAGARAALLADEAGLLRVSKTVDWLAASVDSPVHVVSRELDLFYANPANMGIALSAALLLVSMRMNHSPESMMRTFTGWMRHGNPEKGWLDTLIEMES